LPASALAPEQAAQRAARIRVIHHPLGVEMYQPPFDLDFLAVD
jgi:hypothetical protein